MSDSAIDRLRNVVAVRQERSFGERVNYGPGCIAPLPLFEVTFRDGTVEAVSEEDFGWYRAALAVNLEDRRVTLWEETAS